MCRFIKYDFVTSNKNILIRYIIKCYSTFVTPYNIAYLNVFFLKDQTFLLFQNLLVQLKDWFSIGQPIYQGIIYYLSKTNRSHASEKKLPFKDADSVALLGQYVIFFEQTFSMLFQIPYHERRNRRVAYCLIGHFRYAIYVRLVRTHVWLSKNYHLRQSYLILLLRIMYIYIHICNYPN